ncbi:MAG: hypothetical protein Ta2D_03970 [Rickettsiales bacterium]|nr:MAG: hypothetical protein Ta2D_03970 [Rickettsiales bacterium]
MEISHVFFLFYFIPIFSLSLKLFQKHKTAIYFIHILEISLILLLSLIFIPKLFFYDNVSIKLTGFVLINEYKIEVVTLFYLIIIFFIYLITNICTQNKNTDKRELLIYSINFFSLIGMLFTDDIFNLYIFIQLLSFTIYILGSILKKEYILKVTWEQFTNSTIASMLFLIYILIIFFHFGDTNISNILKTLQLKQTTEYANQFLFSFFIFFSAIFLNFFSFYYYFENIKKSKTLGNMLFINVFFLNFLLGSSIFAKIMPLYLNIDILYFKYFFIFLGTVIIIKEIILLYKKYNLLSYMHSFSLITIAHILFLITFNKNEYSQIAMYSYIYNYMIIDFLFYLILALLNDVYYKNNIVILNLFSKYRYIVYMIMLSKLGFPFGFGYLAETNFLKFIFSEKLYVLLAPYLALKVIYLILLYRFNIVFTKFTKDYTEEYATLNPETFKKETSFKVIIFLSILVFLLSIAFFIFY